MLRSGSGSLSGSPPSIRIAGARTYVPALDGIRGIAILMVAAYHFITQAAQLVPVGGWGYRIVTRLALLGTNGVDLFFVLSGFLITGLLLDTKPKPAFFLNFYARRTLRIFPLYYAFLVLVLVVAPLALPGNVLVHAAGKDQAWVWLYATNIKIALADRWAFCGAAVCGQGIELNHTWSLAVEEHFYLVWPLVVYACSRRMLGYTCALVSVGALALRIALRDHWLPMYVLTPCRLDALVIGAFVATAVRERGLDWLAAVGRWPTAAAVVLFALIAGLPGGVMARPPIVQAFAFSATAVLGAGLVVATLRSSSAPERGVLARALSVRVLRTFGKYSYGLYLFHSALRPVMTVLFPPARLAQLLRSPALGMVAYDVLATGASLGLAWVSYHAFEKRFLQWKDFFAEGRVSPRALDMDQGPDTIR